MKTRRPRKPKPAAFPLPDIQPAEFVYSPSVSERGLEMIVGQLPALFTRAMESLDKPSPSEHLRAQVAKALRNQHVRENGTDGYNDESTTKLPALLLADILDL